MFRPADLKPKDPSSVLGHLRTWGLFWAAVALSCILVGTSLWIHSGISRHASELATVHGQYMLTQLENTGSLDDRLASIHEFGAVGITELGSGAQLLGQAGNARTPVLRAPGHARPVARGHYLIEHRRRGSTLIVEFVPLLAADMAYRARIGVLLAMLTSILLVASVFFWTRHRQRVEAWSIEAERTQHLAQLGTLSTVIAHELRNPLTIVMGHLQILQEDFPDHRNVNRVVRGAQRLDTLLDSLLEFARSGQLQRAPADPMTVLQDAVGSAEVTIDGSAPEWSLDATRVRQALENLLDNARAACPDGPIEARVYVEDQTLFFEIRDHGPGIEPGAEEQIFEAFHTSKTQGTGLGLAVARTVFDKHGGQLTAHNATGGGACFIARIPS